MRRRHLIGLAAGSVASTALPSRTRAQGTLETIHLAAPLSDALTPLYYGLHIGAFQRAGIDLEMVPTVSGTVATTAVVAGTYEIANTSLLAAMAAHTRGVPIVLVAPQAVYTAANPFTLLQIAPDSTFKTGADLNGKTISVFGINDINQLTTSAWVDKHGGDSKTLKFIEIPPSLTPEAIAQHRVDAGELLEPTLDASLAAGTTKTLADAFGAIARTFMFGAYVARRDWADAHADLARRFLRVTIEMSAYTNAHPAETAEMMAELTKIPLPIMQKMKRVVCATSLDPRMVQPLIDAAAHYHQIPQAFPAADFFWNDRGR